MNRRYRLGSNPSEAKYRRSLTCLLALTPAHYRAGRHTNAAETDLPGVTGGITNLCLRKETGKDFPSCRQIPPSPRGRKGIKI